MRDGEAWRAPPPDWPAIQALPDAHNLFDFVDTESPFLGETCDLAGLIARFGRPGV
jgi:hypothetical protein